MKNFSLLTVVCLLILECNLFSQTAQVATGVVAKPTEGAVLAAACDANNFPAFTNLLRAYLEDSKYTKRDVSQLLFDLLACRISYWSPSMEAMEYMRSLGADVGYESNTNLESEWIYTPLQAAVARGNVDIMKWLVAKGADINQISKNQNMTALEWAVMWGRLNVIQWLLQHGARVQEKKTGHSLLHAILRQKLQEHRNLDLLPLLVKAGADPYIKNDEGKAAVDILADDLDIEQLRQIDKKGVYRSLIEKYVPHPAPKGSPFVGVWSNGQDEFGTFRLILNDEGSAAIATGILPGGPFAWRTVSSNQAVIEIPSKELSELKVEWIAPSNAIRVSFAGKASNNLLVKQPDIPPTTKELQAELKGFRK
jgi:ankyrin repeat protein